MIMAMATAVLVGLWGREKTGPGFQTGMRQDNALSSAISSLYPGSG